jgi:hypothetical protein
MTTSIEVLAELPSLDHLLVSVADDRLAPEILADSETISRSAGGANTIEIIDCGWTKQFYK